MSTQSTTTEFMRSNPQHTYGYAVGYTTGKAAAFLGKYAGLSELEWRTATDDYAHGYRAGYTATIKNENNSHIPRTN